MVALKRVTAKTGGKTPHPHRRSGARHTIVWATLANGGRVCGGQSVVVSLWWSVCGGQSVVVSLWWSVCGGQSVVVSLWW
ncbi:hypothetical protein, partial [Ferrovum sp.]|uniref:hypothetical protein n=1 Tax=Ferrovum sp. TaxID=2609467 RepID=UPI0026210460